MDEPTAALTSTEVARLFGVAETLRARGAAVLFISHRLEEVFALCQRVTVMRDGRHVLTQPIEELTTESIIRGDGRPRHGARSSRRSPPSRATRARRSSG